jgi:hypothetical protein
MQPFHELGEGAGIAGDLHEHGSVRPVLGATAQAERQRKLGRARTEPDALHSTADADAPRGQRCCTRIHGPGSL